MAKFGFYALAYISVAIAVLALAASFFVAKASPRPWEECGICRSGPGLVVLFPSPSRKRYRKIKWGF